MMKFQYICYGIVMVCMMPLWARNVILEVKGSYFLPTNSAFRHIYNGSALYGPELTVQLCDDDPWHVFASVEYFQKKGHSLGLCDSTKVTLIPLGIGLKYCAESCVEDVDWYIGLGFQPVCVHTKNYSEFVCEKVNRWGFGGIAKIGAFWYLSPHVVLDFFVDYSFVDVNCKQVSCCQGITGNVYPRKANIGGAIFGIGLGYCF
jgi:outer membrane protein W